MESLGSEEKQEGHFIYEAGEPTRLSQVVAIVSMGVIFTLALGYSVIIAVIVYMWWVHQLSWLMWAVFFLFISLTWATGTWYAIRDCFMLESWRHYFQLRIYKECPIPMHENVLFTSFPHGMFPLAIPLLAGIEGQILPEWGTFPKPLVAISDALFYIPILSTLLRWVGCISVSKESLRSHLSTGSCLLLPDGLAGTYHSNEREEILFAKSRKGYVRLALQMGTTLVPMYCFGHSQLFSVYPNYKHGRGLMTLARRLQFAITFFWGHSWFPPLPRHEPILIVVGKPFKVPLVENVTDAEVEEWHGRYLKEIINLFDNHKHRYGWDESKEITLM